MKRFRSALLALMMATSLPAVMGMGQPLPLAEGRLAYGLGQYEKAQSLFQEAGDANPEAQLWKGHAAYMRGHTEEALAAWQVAAADGSAGTDARGAIDTAKKQLQALSTLLDRYGKLRGAASGPGASPGDWRVLAADFDRLAREAGQSLVGRRAGLLAADCLGYAGDVDDAVKRFDALKDSHPLVTDWALWRMAALDRGHARGYLTTLVQRFPDSPLVLEARVALAETEGDAAARRAVLQNVVRDGNGRPAAERALFLLSQDAGAGQGSNLVKYWNTYPEGRYLDKVVKDLSKLPGLSVDTQYRIGSYYYFVGDYGPATTFFDKVHTSVALYRKGRAYWGLDLDDKAVATMRAVINQDSSLAGRAYLTIGQVEAGRNRWAPAVDAYNQAARYGGESGVTARWKLSRIYKEQKKLDAARQLEQTIVSSFPWSEEATNINWDGFWNALHARRWNDAIVNGRRLASHNPNHAYGVAAQYWLGRIYEKTGKSQEALAVYRGLIGRSPSSYYGWRAWFRQQDLTGKGMDPWFATQPGRKVDDVSIRWADLLGKQERALLAGGTKGTALPREMLDWPENVRELLFLRQYEVADWTAGVGKSPNLKAWMSHLQQRYRDSIRQEQGEPHLNYPLGFAASLVNAAQRNRVDPLLLAALVREESRYDPQIKSYVGATGLAQLMPSTAQWVFKQVPDVAGRPLTDPNTNLQLGAWYLAYTVKSFDGNAMNGVAAYNGGPGAVARWKRGFSGDPDEFVESIPYTETRLYVKKVFSSYWNYVKLYGAP
ncbi:MAG: putative transglycosylase [Cyanobacteria bacterium RYN_339]|nr:putative transglycosylase [Cyanobacteria bacterium RYN_339]